MRRREFLAGGALAAAGCASKQPTTALTSDFGRTRFHTAPDGVRIAFRDSGQMDRPAIFFCSGGGQAMAVWDAIANPLAAKYRVVLHDRRGNGQSDLGAQETHTFESFRSDALGVMDEVGLERATVCGLAFGSRVAVRMALDSPARTNGLILFDATGGPAAPESVRRAGAEEAARLRAAAGLPVIERDPAWTANRNTSGVEFNGRALTGLPAWIKGLDTIRVPTLIALGEQDPNLEGGRRMAREIPNAQFELMPMTGHGSNVQRPDLLRSLIDKFLSANFRI